MKKFLRRTNIIPIKVFALVVAALCLLQGAHSQVNQQTLSQVKLLIAEKNARTPTERKISSQLLQATRELTGRPMAKGVNLLPVKLNKDAGGKVEVDINADVTNSLLNKIRAAGGTIISSFANYHAIRAKITLSAVNIIAAYPEVHYIKPAEIAITVGTGGSGPVVLKPGNNGLYPSLISPAPVKRPSFKERAERVRQQLKQYLLLPGSGSVNSEGDHTMGADSARARYGHSGEGIRVGVLSDSYNRLGRASTDVASGDLPGTGNPQGDLTPVTVVQDYISGTDEGRAMLQIVHDIAPKAQLFFATAEGGQANFASNIKKLRGAPYNCDIIIDDVIYFAEGVFQDGAVAKAVNDVTAQGALFFSSAGNFGSLQKNTGNVWEGDFTDAGSPVFTGGIKTGTIHNFGTVGAPASTNALVAEASGSNNYFLQWGDPLGGSANDYDLFMVDNNGAVVGSSTDIQNGTQDPIEGFAISYSVFKSYSLVIFKAATAQVRAVHLQTFINSKSLTYATTGQTYGHNSAAAAFNVAASSAAAVYPGVFTATSAVENYSSDGLRRIFYNSDGTAVTPGNLLFATNGGVLRSKPDVTGADGVTTSFPSSSPLHNFYGTSAAAPHAGAIAALVKSANPSLTPTQIRNILTSTALDIEAPGYDGNSGYGIVQAANAVAAVVGTPVITSFSPSFATTGVTVNITGTHLLLTSGVSFGGVAATSFTVLSDTSIQATVGTGASGSVSVTNGINAGFKTGFVFGVPPGSALAFNGTDNYVSVTTGSAAVSGSFTIEAWVLPADTVNTLNIFSTSASSGNSFDMKLVAGNLIHASIGTGSTWLTTSADASYKYTAGTWCHIAYAVTPAGYTIYANGNVVGGGTFAGTPLLFDATHNISIGSYAPALEPFNGNIDEVRVYNAELTQANIQADMRATAISVPAALQLYYNFDQSTGTSTIADNTGNHYDGTINGTQPYVFKESYSMVVPASAPATNITTTQFRANWTAPTTGITENYLLDVAADTAFTSILPAYNQLSVAGTSANITGLRPGSIYFYRVRANKSSATGKGAFSNVIAVTTPSPVLSSFAPGIANAGDTIIIKGFGFTGTTWVSFGGTPAASFNAVSDTVISAVVAYGASGRVVVQTVKGTDSLPGFVYLPTPVITSFSPTSATSGTTVTIQGSLFTGATAVTFGGNAPYSYTVLSDTVISAVVGAGASGDVSVTIPTGAASKAGFTYLPAAPPGSAIRLSGAQSVSVASTGTVSGSYTVEAWVRPATLAANISIVSSGAANNNFSFDMRLSGGSFIQASIGNGSAWLTTGANANYNYKAGTWYHIAYVVTPTGYVVYVNGDIAGSGSFSGTPLLYDNTHQVRIGSLANTAEFFNGSIDEVRVYSAALTRANVQGDMKSVAVSVPASLKLYYDFDEPVNTTGSNTTVIKDKSSNNFDGTLPGNATGSFVESYAMVTPTAIAPSAIALKGFTAKWTAPATGIHDNYFLDVATDTAFTSILPAYDHLQLTAVSKAITGLKPGTKYFYRVTANKASVQGQGAYSNTISATTLFPVPTITSFTPSTGSAGVTVTITGTGFAAVTSVSFGGTAARSFNIVSSTTIKAVVNNGASGDISITAPGGTATKSGFTYCTVPAKPSAIKGPTSVQANATGLVYSVTGASSPTYTWTIPADATIVSGQGTRSIKVNWGATAGTVRVVASNACGSSASVKLTVTITSAFAPGTPVVSEAAKVKQDYVKAYPNPVTDIATIEFTAESAGKYEATLVNIPGQQITKISGFAIAGTNKITIDMSRLAPALYYIRLVDKQHGVRIIKLVKAR